MIANIEHFMHVYAYVFIYGLLDSLDYERKIMEHQKTDIHIRKTHLEHGCKTNRKELDAMKNKTILHRYILIPETKLSSIWEYIVRASKTFFARCTIEN